MSEYDNSWSVKDISIRRTSKSKASIIELPNYNISQEITDEIE